jgi:hypothetical protein
MREPDRGCAVICSVGSLFTWFVPWQSGSRRIHHVRRNSGLDLNFSDATPAGGKCTSAYKCVSAMRNNVAARCATKATRCASIVTIVASVIASVVASVLGASAAFTQSLAQAPLPNSTFERPIGGGPPVSGTLSNDVRGVPTRTHQFFTMDLPRAALSPQPLGPLSQFAPSGVTKAGATNGRREGTTTSEQKPAQTNAGQIKTSQIKTAESVTLPRQSANRTSSKVIRTAQVRQRAVRLARRSGGNPLDAQAFDVRIRRWPCDGGGICDWQNPPGFNPFQGWQSTRAPGGLPPPGAPLSPQPQTQALQYAPVQSWPAQTPQYPFAFR